MRGTSAVWARQAPGTLGLGFRVSIWFRSTSIRGISAVQAWLAPGTLGHRRLVVSFPTRQAQVYKQPTWFGFFGFGV